MRKYETKAVGSCFTNHIPTAYVSWIGGLEADPKSRRWRAAAPEKQCGGFNMFQHPSIGYHVRQVPLIV